MREKTLKLIVTFYTTADAIMLEKECKKHDIKGRLIPVPRIFSAGCGMAWCCDIKYKKILKEILFKIDINEENLHEYIM